jgi:predicted GIY-YIG superfamily endonuclease/GNAT superfamily N-acetyltransferase
MAMLYILHLDSKLAHTQHYCGSTKNLKQRLTAHALGRAARYTQVLAERQIEWRLGGLFQCNHAVMRRLERVIKDNHRIAKFCEICTERPSTLTGTLKYEIALIPFPTTSHAIREAAGKVPTISYRIATKRDTAKLTKWMISIMKVERDALGFIPGGHGRGVEDLIHLGRVLMAEASGEPIGYLAHTASKDHARITIHQLCVEDVFRFYGVGREMLQYLRSLHPQKEMVAKVRYNLAANHFWNRVGFQLATSVPHETSGNLIHHYYLTPQMELR